MQDMIVELFESYVHIALVLSIIINVVISLLGFVPSVFLTAANLAVFGLWGGLAVSFAGEALGASIAFILYRKGFRRLKNMRGFSHPKVQKLLEADGKEAFLLIIALRIFPFMPSGLVTFVASIGSAAFSTFFIASTLGKIPAILIEGLSVYQIINMEWEWKIISILTASTMMIYVSKRIGFRGNPILGGDE
ncbi:VTT domain-containing protein [Bacillus infantis]|uniref:TVP38/TMEM64 family protein n=1 Tax=Bacillus infantis TaxID=324767 RepID=UPI00301628F2